MGNLRDLAEDLWSGRKSTQTLNPLAMFAGLEELADGVAFISSLANVSMFATDDGLVLVDTGGYMVAGMVVQALRGWSDAPVHTEVFTHGHVDHVFGAPALDKEADDAGRARPRVIAHEALPPRFDRYKLTAGYNGAINARQFRTPGLRWPTDYRYPDETYRDRLDLEIGGLRFELRHDRGETDDHTWVWIPEHEAICTGDLFIWAAPNCGNPQKAQRYPREWARALDKMADVGARLLLPGHGPPIFGADRVEQALRETAELLDTVHDRTLELMNEGKRLDEIIHAIELPKALLERPYLRPVYDEPAFIVRNLWRLYGGWYDGNPARLKPAPDATVARQVASMAGGVKELARRARELAESGDLETACQLAEWAWQADPANAEARAARGSIYDQRAESETSLMARSIYMAAAEESRRDR